MGRNSINPNFDQFNDSPSFELIVPNVRIIEVGSDLLTTIDKEIEAPALFRCNLNDPANVKVFMKQMTYSDRLDEYDIPSLSLLFPSVIKKYNLADLTAKLESTRCVLCNNLVYFLLQGLTGRLIICAYVSNIQNFKKLYYSNIK